MHRRLGSLLPAVAVIVLIGDAGAYGDLVDLDFDPAFQTVWLDDTVDIDFVASSSGSADQPFAAIDAILVWDPVYLEFLGADDTNAGYPFGPVNHFMPDLDGINDDLDDGDALFTALAQMGEEAMAPPDGLVVTTFQFRALAGTYSTIVELAPSMGVHAVTRVRRLDLSDVTGDISGTGAVMVIDCNGQTRGDCNGDGSINGLDIDPFVEALVDADGFNAQHAPLLWQCVADVNCDGSMNGLDIDPFVECLTNGCPPCAEKCRRAG